MILIYIQINRYNQKLLIMDKEQKVKEKLPDVFFEIQINKVKKGRIVFELYDDIVPKTCENFRTLAQRQKPKGYKGSKFYKIVKDFALTAGDYINEDGTGGKSIFADNFFEDQNFKVLHKRPYLLIMNNNGPNTNSSQFNITTRKTPWLNKVNVVFGQVKTGFDLIDVMENLGSKQGVVSGQIIISNCGIIQNSHKKISNLESNFIPPTQKLPFVFFQISINNAKKGKIFFELYDEIVPKTCLNFRTLAQRKKPNGYKGIKFYKVLKDFVCVSGDFQNQNGSGGRSIFQERYFDDQNFKIQHNKPFILTMNNKGPNTNSSQFYITKRKAPWLNSSHVAFGQVICGQDILQIMNCFGSDYGQVKAQIIITDTGNANEEEIQQYKIQREAQKIKPPKEKQPHVFFDIQINKVHKGRIIFELRDDVVPKTCLNFRTLAQRKKPEGYKGSKIYRIISQFIIVGGDYINENGSAGRSIFENRFFDDENFNLSHNKPYLLTMGNEGPHSNSSEFYITKRKTPWLNGVHVVFGQVKQGFQIIDEIDKCGSDQGDVISQITIVDSGICEYVEPPPPPPVVVEKKIEKQEKNQEKKEENEKQKKQKQKQEQLQKEANQKAEEKKKKQQQKKLKLEELKKKKQEIQKKKIQQTKPKPNVYFQIEINKVNKGRIIFKLRDDIAPKTCQNFRTLSQRSKPDGYKGTKFYKVIKNLSCFAGDYINENGTGGKSIYESKQFKVQNFELLHSKPYMLSMNNQGKNMINSQFFITKRKAPWLNDLHVVFGQVLSGFEIVDEINQLGSEQGEIKSEVVIVDCGIL